MITTTSSLWTELVGVKRFLALWHYFIVLFWRSLFHFTELAVLHTLDSVQLDQRNHQFRNIQLKSKPDWTKSLNLNVLTMHIYSIGDTVNALHAIHFVLGMHALWCRPTVCLIVCRSPIQYKFQLVNWSVAFIVRRFVILHSGSRDSMQM